jgi:uncharacterized protein YdeI (YjbR/CyaY-like superfamily)
MPDPDPTTLPLIVSPAEFEAWLQANGETSTEYWVRFHKKSSPYYSVDLRGLIDVALCYGWIDVKGRRVDEYETAIRFTPRRPKSNWSEINRVAARRLIADGRMQPPGFARLPDDL